jgi:hypothetical protein
VVGRRLHVAPGELQLCGAPRLGELEADQRVEPAAADRLGKFQRHRHVGVELRLPGRVAQQPPVAGGHVAGVEVNSATSGPAARAASKRSSNGTSANSREMFAQ